MDWSRTPRLRAVDIRPVEENGETLIVLEDPQELGDGPLVLAPLAGWLLQFFDGQTSLQTIRDRFQAETDESLPEKSVNDLLEVLDQNFFLENERSHKKKQKMFDEYHESDTREATLPGKSIPENASEIETFFENEISGESTTNTVDSFRGLVLPHIDYERGRNTYSKMVPLLKEIPDVNRIIFLGVSHYPCRVPFALTKKTFESPFGDVNTDTDAVKSIQNEVLSYSFEESAMAHRLEHSIEIPLLLLQYAKPNLDFSIVPLICSYASEQRQEETLRGITQQLEKLLKMDDTFLIAGVDFAHMGPQFGDQEPLSSDDFQHIENCDREMIETLERADSDAFERHIQSDNNKRRVCGYPALRTLLPLFDDGELIQYEQWDDPEGTVSYAGMAMR